MKVKANVRLLMTEAKVVNCILCLYSHTPELQTCLPTHNPPILEKYSSFVLAHFHFLQMKSKKRIASCV